jgi:hypothetical protein
MTIRLPRVLLAATATVSAVLLTVGPANAAHRTEQDTPGDAPARLDITRYGVTNTSQRITAVIHVQNLKKTGIFQQRYYDSAFDSEPSYGVTVRRDRHGHLHVRAFRDDENGDHDIACPDVSARWQPVRNRVRTSMPVSCTNGLDFDPLNADVISIDTGDLGVKDSTKFLAVPRD